MTGQVYSKPVPTGKRAAPQNLSRNDNNGKKARTETTLPAGQSLLPSENEQPLQDAELPPTTTITITTTPTIQLACPFSLHPVQKQFYTKCRDFTFKRFSDLRVHFIRHHIRPACCFRCGNVYVCREKHEVCARHLRQQVPCKPHPSRARPHAGFSSEDELEALLGKGQRGSGITLESKWLGYWSKIFPGDPPPESPSHHETADAERLRRALPQAIEDAVKNFLRSERRAGEGHAERDAETMARFLQYCRKLDVAAASGASGATHSGHQQSTLASSASISFHLSASRSLGTIDTTPDLIQPLFSSGNGCVDPKHLSQQTGDGYHNAYTGYPSGDYNAHILHSTDVTASQLEPQQYPGYDVESQLQLVNGHEDVEGNFDLSTWPLLGGEGGNG